MTDEEMSEIGFEKKKTRIVLKYKDKEYVLEEENWMSKDEYTNEWNWYIWEEGNYSCDCNRSLFLHRKYPEFSEFEHCGNEIELVDYEVIN